MNHLDKCVYNHRIYLQSNHRPVDCIMATEECCVLDCPAKQIGKRDLTYFSLPVAPDRQLQWLKLIGRPDLYRDRLTENYFVCSIHFDSSQLNMERKVLPNAVPTRHIPKERKGVLIYRSNTGTQTNFHDDDDDYIPGSKRKTDDDIGNVIMYKRRAPNRKVFACLEIDDYLNFKLPDIEPVADIPPVSLINSRYEPRDSIELGNRKIFVFSEDENAKTSDKTNDKPAPVSNEVSNEIDKTGGDIVISEVLTLNPNAVFKKFNEWRQRAIDRRKGSKYEKVFKIFALNLHSINTRAYRLLSQSWKLPKERELMEIELNVTPKFDESVIKLLTQKFKSLSTKAKYCTLGLYIVPLKPHLFYDPANDEVIGVHNVNGEKKREAANYALVAMVRGLKVPWCQPVAFSLFSTMDVDDMDVFITTVIVKLRSMGLKILGVVMANDHHFYSYCRSTHFISVVKPYLNINKETVFVVFDLPHVLNSFKNEFIKNDLMFENKMVSWSYIKQVYEVDKERGGRLLPNLSEEHMKASRDNSMKHPCQVLHRTVAGAISFYINHGLLPAEAAQTAELIKRINDVFDVLNANKTTTGIRNTDTPSKLVSAQAKAIENASGIIKKLATAKVEKTQEPDSLKFFQISLKALLYISLALKDASLNGIEQMSLSYLEPMLEFIKSIKADNKRQKPTPVQFTKSFSKLFLKYLIELTPSPTSIGKMENFLKMADGVKDCYETYDGQRIYIKDKEYRFRLPEVYAIIYVSSFLLYKCSEKHMCTAFEGFLNRLVDLKRTKVYVNFEKFNKDAPFYDILKFPPIELPAYVERLDNCFLKCFSDFYLTNPAESIYRALTKVAPWDPPCPCFPFDYMLKLFVRTRMYETVLHNTRCLKNKSVEIPYTVEAQKL